MRDGESCKTCSAASRTSPAVLECRAQPPVATPIVGPNQFGRPEVIAKIASFPIVQPDWWCRGYEFERKDDDQDHPTPALITKGTRQ